MKTVEFSNSILYFFGYKTEFFFSFHKQSQKLDPSYKMDLGLWDCSGRVKLITNFIGLINLFGVIIEWGNPVL